MNISKQVLKTVMALFLVSAMLVSSPESIVRATEKAEKVNMSLIGKYDSADTAAIRDINTVRKQIRFRNHSTGKTYTLSYDNTSMMYDARGTVLSASLLEVGQIVDVTFLKSSKHITTLNVSKDAWTVEDTRDHELVRGDGTARVKGDIYKIDNRTLIMADGELALAEDVLATDRVRVSGIGKEIYSVMVTGGHGYVSLSSDTVEDHSLVGAWIELDNEVIHKISPNMLLSAPEGDYTLQILGNGANYQSEVNISRNQETVVDTSNVNIEKPREGLVTFEISPDNAEVFVDGERVLTDTPQSIRYGYHSLKIMADGYITQNKYLKIGTPKSVISIELDKDEDSSAASSEGSSEESGASNASSYQASYYTGASEVSTMASTAASTAATVSDNSSSGRNGTNKVITGYKVYFDKPYGAELYFDGSYIGMIPTSVTKVSGAHEVILKQNGHETKSYRINIDSEEVDLTYTFQELEKIVSDDSSSSSSASTASSEASTGDSSSSDGSTTGDSSAEGDSAATGETTSAADASTSGDTSSTGGTSSEGSTEGATAESSSPSSSSGESKEEGGSTNTNSTDGNTNSGSSESSSTGATTTQEGTEEAASTASG